MDSSVFESILEIFRSQISLQGEIQEQAKKMRTVILSRELSQISAVSHTMDQLTAETERLEIERRQILAESDLGPAANRSFTSLLRMLPEEQAAPLGEIHNELKAKIKETSRFTIGNRILLEEALSSVRKSIEVIAQRTAKPSTGYDYTGRSNQNKRKFINQVG